MGEELHPSDPQHPDNQPPHPDLLKDSSEGQKLSDLVVTEIPRGGSNMVSLDGVKLGNVIGVDDDDDKRPNHYKVTTSDGYTTTVRVKQSSNE